MIDLGLLRQDPEKIIQLIQKKDPRFDAQRLVDLDRQVRQLKNTVEELQHTKNELAQAAKGGVTPEIREQSKLVSTDIKNKMSELDLLEQQFKELYLTVPNIPEDEVPAGNKESNQVVKIVGKKPTYNFDVKNHTQLAEALGWLDFSTAATLTGSNFALYKSEGVTLLYSLSMLMLKNNREHGFDPVLPSVLVNEKSLEVSGNFPKFKEQVYATNDGLYLSPTSEVNLTNMYRDHIFAQTDLPVRMTAWTSCFRREAGSYGANERGLIRIHQFEKVELVTLCEPEKSPQELERMLACAESILQKLGLHYRVSLLAAQDCSFQAAKTYDIEVWLPGQKEYYEVSSVSNCSDFQARRGMIRYRPAQGKTKLVHTLNGSSLALPRLMVALIETYQQPDGSIILPGILKNTSLL